MVAMAEILALVLLTAALVWWVTRTNLFRHWRWLWRRHRADPGGLNHGAFRRKAVGRRWHPSRFLHAPGGAARSPNHRI